MSRAAPYFVAVILAGCGCSGSPLAPDGGQRQLAGANELATISGTIYASLTWAEPPVPDALISVDEVDGSTTTVMSDADGFYQLSVKPGRVSIRAAKDGYRAKTSDVTLLTHTVLNVFLAPI